MRRKQSPVREEREEILSKEERGLDFSIWIHRNHPEIVDEYNEEEKGIIFT